MAALDLIPQLDLVCLDKTGVLTTRDVSVSQIHYMSEMPTATPLGSPDRETVNLTESRVPYVTTSWFSKSSARLTPSIKP